MNTGAKCVVLSGDEVLLKELGLEEVFSKEGFVVSVDKEQSSTIQEPSGSVSLRDYFAAKAMNAILSDPDIGLQDADLRRYAAISYKMSDAMLKAKGVQ